MAGLLLTAALIAGCGGDPPATVVAPPPPPPAPPPSITSVTPATGSTAGGAWMQIVGTGFRSGVVAVFDGVSVRPAFDSRDVGLTTMFLETPPHAAGTIDIVVTNPDGQSARYAGGHTYAAPETFDTKGEWVGEAQDGSHRLVGFTIQNGKLVSAYCVPSDGAVTLPLAEPINVIGGAFSVSEIMSGRIASTTQMVGTMNFQECSFMSWRAYPRAAPSLHR